MKRFRVNEEMPGWARAFAAVMGIGLIAIGALMFIVESDRHWKQLLVAFISVGLGIDLLVGAVRARWPAAALLWLAP